MFASKVIGLPHTLAVFISMALLSAPTVAQDTFPPRTKLKVKSDSPELHGIVAAVCDPATKRLQDLSLKRSDVYFRLTERQYVMDGGDVNEEAYLGGSPYVFLTVPEVAYGRSLYGIYSDLGYDAEGVLKQRNKEMVALILRYKPEVQFSPVVNGDGPLDQSDFNQYVYIPTWTNAYALFARLAEKTNPDPDHWNPMFMSFDNESDRNMALYFPADRRDHIDQLPYGVLRMAGSPDWEYRKLLESKMSMNSHFRGVGITENTLSPADNRFGVKEFVGPNRQLKDLQDYAVIDIGSMKFLEVHDH